MNWRKWIVWAGAGIVATAAIVTLIVHSQRWRPRTIAIQGAVIRKDADPRNAMAWILATSRDAQQPRR